MTVERNVLVVEDSAEISELVSLHLRDIGCRVQCAGDGETALALAEAGTFDLIILDLMLPGLDGLAVCSRLRPRKTMCRS